MTTRTLIFAVFILGFICGALVVLMLLDRPTPTDPCADAKQPPVREGDDTTNPEWWREGEAS